MENEKTEATESLQPSVTEPQRMPTMWVIILCTVGIVLLFAATVVGIIRLQTGMEQRTVSKEFSINGLAVTLNDRFSIYEGQENAAMSDQYAYTAIRVEYTLLALDGKTVTAHDYLDSARDLNHVKASDIQTAYNGVEYFTFTDTVEVNADGTTEKKNYHYFVFVVKGDDCFYIGQFFCEDEVNRDTRDEQFAAWAKTAREVPMEPSSAT